MTVALCPHGAEFPLEPCNPCQTEANPPAPSASRVDVGPPFAARHETVCPGCGFDIVPGQQARMVSRRGALARAHHDGTCVAEVSA